MTMYPDTSMRGAQAVTRRSGVYRPIVHGRSDAPCGCQAQGDAFLNLLADYEQLTPNREGAHWTDVRPLTAPHHWTCRATDFQQLLIGRLAGGVTLPPGLLDAMMAGTLPSADDAGRPGDGRIEQESYCTAPGGDLLLLDGRIFTADRQCPWVEALAIRDGRIVDRGSSEAMLALAGDWTTPPRIVRLEGRTVIPGFNDAHLHHTPDPAGIRLPVDVRRNPDLAELVEMIREAVARSPAGTWIYGVMGERLINDPRLDRGALDPVSPDHPVILLGLTNHSNVVNSAAMARLDLMDDMPDPLGGRFGRQDGTQRLSGRIEEYAQWAPQRCFAAMTTVEEGASQLRAFSDQCLLHGITTIQNMSWTPIERYVAMLREARLPLRVRVIRFPPSGPAGRHIGEGASLARQQTPRIEVSGTKWILDGTTVERGAAMVDGYADDPQSRGRMNFNSHEIREMLRENDRSGDPLLLHAIGTHAVGEVLDAAEALNHGDGWAEKGLRIEHGDGLNRADIARVRALGIQVVQNPSHFLATEIYRPRFGDACEYAAFRQLVEAGVPVGIGSDGPLNPFIGLMAAVLHPARPSEAIDMEMAVRAYTWGSAIAEGKGDHKGLLAPGYLADLAVLSEDIFTIDPAHLPDCSSVMTIIDGHVVHETGQVAG
jgi:predicted amidohydrolase YtcJ